MKQRNDSFRLLGDVQNTLNSKAGNLDKYKDAVNLFRCDEIRTSCLFALQL